MRQKGRLVREFYHYLKMDCSKYWPPPIGVRSKRMLENGDFTFRNPESGPYGIFILKRRGQSVRCLPGEQADYRVWWENATPQMKKMLWGSHPERQSAKQVIRGFNEEIRDFNVAQNRNRECGVIDDIDWTVAGRQLDLAVRDKCLYNSTARFEDVRDFIWERIQNRTYPEDWEVTWQDFEDKISRRSANFENIRNGNGLDNQDSAYRFYENPVAPMAPVAASSSESRRSTRVTRYQNRHGPLSVQGGGISRREAEPRRSRRRQMIRLEELGTQLASPARESMENLR